MEIPQEINSHDFSSIPIGAGKFNIGSGKNRKNFQWSFYAYAQTKEVSLLKSALVGSKNLFNTPFCSFHHKISSSFSFQLPSCNDADYLKMRVSLDQADKRLHNGSRWWWFSIIPRSYILMVTILKLSSISWTSFALINSESSLISCSRTALRRIRFLWQTLLQPTATDTPPPPREDNLTRSLLVSCCDVISSNGSCSKLLTRAACRYFIRFIFPIALLLSKIFTRKTISWNLSVF